MAEMKTQTHAVAFPGCCLLSPEVAFKNGVIDWNKMKSLEIEGHMAIVRWHSCPKPFFICSVENDMLKWVELHEIKVPE